MNGRGVQLATRTDAQDKRSEDPRTLWKHTMGARTDQKSIPLPVTCSGKSTVLVAIKQVAMPTQSDHLFLAYNSAHALALAGQFDPIFPIL